MNPDSNQAQQTAPQNDTAQPLPEQPSASGPAPVMHEAVQGSMPASFDDSDQYQVLLPTKNKFALKSYYYSCIGIFPVIGAPFSILAIANGRKALQLYKKNPTPGAKAHAIFGISLSIIELIFLLLILFAAIDFIVR